MKYHISEILIWDLDKTYLDTRFETLRGIIKTALEPAEDKQAFRSASALLRALAYGNSDWIANLTFLSASPPSLRHKVLRKLRSDGVPVTAMIFKDAARNLRPSRWALLANHVPYKLSQLLRLSASNPGKTVACFGDDWELDPFVYMVFRDLRSGLIDAQFLRQVLVRLDLHEQIVEQSIEQLQPYLDALRGTVASSAQRDGLMATGDVQIFVHRVRYRPISLFQLLGPKVVPYESYIQLSVRAYQESWISQQGAAQVLQQARSQWAAKEIWHELLAGLRLGTIRNDRFDQVHGFIEQFLPQMLDDAAWQRLYEVQATSIPHNSQGHPTTTSNQDKLEQLVAHEGRFFGADPVVCARYDQALDLLHGHDL